MAPLRDLLDLPERSAKPRDDGVTHVIDRGLSIAEIEGMIEVAGEFVDIVKLGWGTALATGNLERKLERYRAHGIPVVLGGTLTELAISRGRLDELIERLAQEFTVLSEVGSKDDTGAITPPYVWVEQMRAELAAGAWKVIAEGREAGTAGIFRPSGEVREGLIGEIVHEIAPARIMFDAPRKDQQVWFVRRFGPEVNLSNVPVGEVLALETLRLGLRSDTLGIGGR